MPTTEIPLTSTEARKRAVEIVANRLPSDYKVKSVSRYDKNKPTDRWIIKVDRVASSETNQPMGTITLQPTGEIIGTSIKGFVIS